MTSTYIRLVIGALLVLLSKPAQAQREFDTWYFGRRAGLAFNGTAVRPLTDGAMLSGEGCAAISDAQGNLLFYSNGVYAWNRLHRRLANGTDLGSYKDSTRTELPPNSATQGVAIVPKPGSSTQYYIFTVDAAENGLANGLRYSVVDMTRQGGLGEVVSKNTAVPSPIGDGRLTEKLLVVRHANQRDIWVLVHAWNSNVFLSYLLTANGIAAPVLSAGGSIHRGGLNLRGDYNCIGYMKASLDGRKLAVAQYHGALELFDFNYGTGVVSGGRLLDGAPLTSLGYYGVEFSPDGKLLYASSNSYINQYELLSGRKTVLPSGPFIGALQVGPDQKIYVSSFQFLGNYTSLAAIEQPNVAGAGCTLRQVAITLAQAGQGTQMGLPNVLVRPPVPGDVLVNFGVLGTGVCLGETSFFTASIYPLIPDATISWNFGEPASGAANTATGAKVAHRYASVGTYTVTMTVREVSGRTHTYTQSVTINTALNFRLTTSAQGLCAGEVATLSITPNLPGGTVVRWQDGTAGLQHQARTSGLYWVEVTPPQQCTQRDSIRLSFAPRPTVALGPAKSMCANELITLNPGPQPAGSFYKWQDGSTRPTYTVSEPGTYSVTVTSPAGCQTQGSVAVESGSGCPFKIPNVITPNNDDRNDVFVLEGLVAREWNLQVFNRWGREVYQQTSYDNRWGAAGLPAAVYHYLLVHPRSGRSYRGWVEVVR